jgi:DNA-directed RNA polymerase subunit RPC12/RpoP
MMKNKAHCYRCSRTVELGEVDYSGPMVTCPNCEDEVLFSESDVRDILDKVDAEASDHGRDYASGMRLARQIIEKELIQEFSE